jgi:1A family penicillin-binding protein
MADSTQHPPRRLRRVLRWVLRGFALGLLLALSIGAYFWLSTPLPSTTQLRDRETAGNTRILDRNGRLLYAIPDPFDSYQKPVALEAIPLNLRQATIAIEDRSFYTNRGVDLRGIARAGWANLHSGTVVAGGSTITQQLSRNFLLDPALAQQRTFERKLRESVLALKLTASYTKDEILALYLNQTFYGGMSYGVEAAAQHFFGKPVRDLDLAECALLAGLPQAPSAYNPFSNPEAALSRQAEVLAAMVQTGDITPQQAAVARAETLQFATLAAPMRAPHFVGYVLDQLTPVLGVETVMRGGLTITTTLDADLQAAAEQTLQHQIEQLATPRNGGPDHQVRNGAIVVLDPRSGAILTLVGSPDFANTAIQGQVNAAVAHRQPGSAIKPLTYAAALERGWTPATTIYDVPATFANRGGAPYSPENYDHDYHGPLALREALATSSNVAAVKVLNGIGIPALLKIAGRLGISTLGSDSGRYGLALTLGGGEVTLLELTGAYAAFANQGQRYPPRAILAITDAQGQPVPAELLAPAQPEAALSPQVAYLISDMLSDRYARSRAYGPLSPLDVDRPAAVKTGTTSDWRDNWTIGYTPDRVVGVWVGNADGQPMEAISGVTGAGPVWHEVMLAAHRGLPAREFARPAGIVELAICAEGGKLPSAVCPATRIERFIAGTQPTQPDDTHQLIRIDPVQQCRIGPGSSAEGSVVRSYRRLPLEAEVWATAQGLPQPPKAICPAAFGAAPAAASDRLATAQPPTPTLIAPADGSIFALSPGVPLDRQQIGIQAQAGSDVSSLTIFLDDVALATFTQAPYQTLWQLTPGSHRIYVVATNRHQQTWRSPETNFIVSAN